MTKNNLRDFMVKKGKDIKKIGKNFKFLKEQKKKKKNQQVFCVILDAPSEF